MKILNMNSKNLLRNIFRFGIMSLLLFAFIGCQGSSSSSDNSSGESISVISKADEYEGDGGDDTFADASLIENGMSQVHNFFDDGTDWLKFNATAGTEYIVETQNLTEGVDTFIYLYGVNGITSLTYNDDGGVLKASKLTWKANTNGTYYIKINSYGDSIGINKGYTVSLNPIAQANKYIDLKVSEFYIPSTLKSITEPINGRIAIKNQGSSDINTPFKIGVYLSTDNIIGATDMLIGYYEIASLKAGEALYSYDTNISIPSSALDLIPILVNGLPSLGTFTNITLGETYYVGVIVDVLKNITEVDESNNISSAAEIVVEIPAVFTQILIDNYEEDDTQDSATKIQINDQQNHNFYDDANDWLKFYAYAHSEYTIETSGLGLLADTQLSLSGMNGDNDTTDDNSGTDSTYASKIVFRPKYSGNYNIKVSSISNAIGLGHEYTISLSSVVVSANDLYEEDDSATVSKIIESGETQNHNFYDDADDWLQFDASAGVKYIIETKSLGALANTLLELYDFEGTLLASDDNSGTNSLNASKVTWTAPTTGRYYIKTSSINSRGDDRNYAISLQKAPTPDSYEEDDNSTNATLINVEDSQNHNFLTDANDWLKFDAVAGIVYQIETSGLSSLANTQLTLYATDGITELASDDNSGADSTNASLILWTATVGGTYFIKVNSFGNIVGDNHQYRVTLSQPSL